MDYKKPQNNEVAALRYLPDKDGAPQIVAAGKGEAAAKILEIAKENNIPVYENPELVHTLNRLEIGSEIPSELYEVVAEILIFVSNLDKIAGHRDE